MCLYQCLLQVQYYIISLDYVISIINWCLFIDYCDFRGFCWLGVLVHKRKTMADMRPRVYMDVRIARCYAQRMIFELFYDIAPFTAENFRALCTGEKGFSPRTGEPLWYRNTCFQKVKQDDTYVKGGAICYANGLFRDSIYGSNFPNEPNNYEHNDRGLLSINKEDCKTHGSHFLITLKRNGSINSSHVVFGKLVEGQEALDDLEKYGFGESFRIISCGQLDRDDGSSFSEDKTDAGCFSLGSPPQWISMEDEDC